MSSVSLAYPYYAINKPERYYGSRMRDELLAIEQFASLLEAQVLVGDWRIEYNTYRPHSALGMLTPIEYELRYAHNLARDQAS